MYQYKIGEENEAKRLRATTIAGSQISIWKAIQKNQILLLQLWKNKSFDISPKIIQHFVHTNNILPIVDVELEKN